MAKAVPRKERIAQRGIQALFRRLGKSPCKNFRLLVSLWPKQHQDELKSGAKTPEKYRGHALFKNRACDIFCDIFFQSFHSF